MQHPKLELVKYLYNRPTTGQAVSEIVTESMRERLEKKTTKKNVDVRDALNRVCHDTGTELATSIRDFREQVELEIRKAAESAG